MDYRCFLSVKSATQDVGARSIAKPHDPKSSTQPKNWGQHSSQLGKHPITVFLKWHDFHYPSSSQHRAGEQGSSCLSHLTGMACGLCNRAEWVRAGRCPSVTVAPGGAIFSSFASSCVSLAACQSDERYFLWVTALFSFVNPEPRRPPVHNAVVCSPGGRPASKHAFFYNWTFSDKMHFALYYAYSMLA